MGTTEVLPVVEDQAIQAHHNRNSRLLVFCCTIIGAAAQMLMKLGSNNTPGVSPIANPLAFAFALLHNLPLFLGYALYGVNTMLLVLALRKGELSGVYPIIALTYVWVTIISFFVFHESANPLKVAGLLLILFGVSVLGRKDKTA